MKTVGIRELKDRLSSYLREAAAGEPIVVTDRGKPVAEILPAGASGLTGAGVGLMALVRAGRATAGEPNEPTLYPLLPPLLRPGRAQELLDEERGDR